MGAKNAEFWPPNYLRGKVRNDSVSGGEGIPSYGGARFGLSAWVVRAVRFERVMSGAPTAQIR